MSDYTQLAMTKDLQVDQQVLTFELNEEMFGLEILKVKELLEYSSITKVPMVPDYIRGVINLRGSVVPVVDLMYLFSKKASEITKKSCIIIVENMSAETESYTGILVDSVNEVVDLTGEQIDPAPAFGTNLNTKYILGMARVQDHIVILLDMDYLLTFDELSGLGQLDFKKLYDQSKMKE